MGTAQMELCMLVFYCVLCSVCNMVYCCTTDMQLTEHFTASVLHLTLYFSAKKLHYVMWSVVQLRLQC